MDRFDVKNSIQDAVNNGKRTIILCAPGGYGKSYIAKDYCNESVLQDRAFINTRDEIRKQLNYVYESQFREDISNNQMQDGSFANLIYSQLDESCGENDTWVVVYDDVALKRDEFRTFLKEFKYVPRRGKKPKGLVIITTRKDWGYKNNNNVQVVPVPEVNEAVARAFLKDSIVGITENDIDEIIEKTDRIALPLSIAGASIVKKTRLKGLSITEAVHDFCNEVTLSNSAVPDDTDYDKNLYKAIYATVSNIRNLEDNHESAYDFLICSAMTAPTQFERQVEYSRRLGITDWENAHAAIAGWHLFEADDSYSMHPTTQDVLLHIDRNSNPEDYYGRLCRAASAFESLCKLADNKKDGCIIVNTNPCGNQYSSEIETAKRIQGLLLAVVKEAVTSSYYTCLCEHLYNLSYGVAYYYYANTNNYKDREQYYKNAYDGVLYLLENDPDNNDLHYKKAAQLKYWGVTLRALDRNDEAKKRFDEAISIYDNFGQDNDVKFWHELAAEAYYNRGLVQSDKGYTADVLNDYLASFDIANEFKLKDQVAVAQRCIGIYHRDTGNYPEAIRWFNKSIRNGNKENAARCLTCLGLTYAMKGDWAESIKKSQEAVAKYKTAKVKSSYNPLLHIEMCYRKQGREDLSKEYLLKASKLLFDESTDSTANQIEAILDGSTKSITLNGKDFRRDGIACMLFCVRCIVHIVAFSSNIKDNTNIQKLMDMAFAVRDECFRTLRENLLRLNGVEMTTEEIANSVIGYTRTIVYNKLTCATLLLACSKYYNKCDETKKAFVFAVAAFYLSDAYNYAYGKEASKSLISGMCEPFNQLPIVTTVQQDTIQTDNTTSFSGINKCLFNYAEKSSLYWKAVGNCSKKTITSLVHALGPIDRYRYVATYELMKKIWASHPELGLSPEYKLLAESEYGGEFYSRYRDHMTHMFKVFLLGGYLYENHPQVHAAFKKRGYDDGSFLSTWILTALYHDIGYLIEKGDGEEESAKIVYGQLNDSLSLPLSRLFPKVFNAHSEKDQQKRQNLSPAKIDGIFSIESMLCMFDGFGEDVRLSHNPNSNPIKKYFNKQRTISSGRTYYDHGIVSACIMKFSWDSICSYIQAINEDELYTGQQEIEFFRSSTDKVTQYVNDAARAVALHNIKKDLEEAAITYLFNKEVTISDFLISLDKEPLAYLLRLCDEIQCWDRQRFDSPIKEDDNGNMLERIKDEQPTGEMFELIEDRGRFSLKIQSLTAKRNIAEGLNGIISPALHEIITLV